MVPYGGLSRGSIGSSFNSRKRSPPYLTALAVIRNSHIRLRAGDLGTSTLARPSGIAGEGGIGFVSPFKSPPTVPVHPWSKDLDVCVVSMLQVWLPRTQHREDRRVHPGLRGDIETLELEKVSCC